MSAPTQRPYQLCVYVGPSAPTIENVQVLDLTPTEPTLTAVIDKLRSSTLSPADLRAKVLFLADGDHTYTLHALTIYAALIGLITRRVDFATSKDGTAVSLDDLDRAIRDLPKPPRPDTPILTAQVSAAPRDDIPTVTLTEGLSTDVITVIRHARRLRFVPPETTEDAIQQLVAIAALRARDSSERLPTLNTGTEPIDASETVGICLDTIRRAAEELRKDARGDNRDAIADRALHDTYALFDEADQVPVETTLDRLGVTSKLVEVTNTSDEAGDSEPSYVEMWHCPRPDRHTNGDATPSAKITVKDDGSYFQCFRCDAERVQSLRLVMDVKGWAPTEAAYWLLNP